MKYYTIATQSNKNGKMCYLCHDIIYDYDLSYNVHDAVQFDSEIKARDCYNELKRIKTTSTEDISQHSYTVIIPITKLCKLKPQSTK